MKKVVTLLSILMFSGYVSAASQKLLTVQFDLPDDKAKCTYMFFSEGDKLRYEANPISTNHCPRTIDLSGSSISAIAVTIPITNVVIDRSAKTCTVKVNRLAPNSPYIYSFEGSDRDCNQKVKVTLDEPKS